MIESHNSEAALLTARQFGRLTEKGRIDMADDRERNQGVKQGTGEGGGQHAPGRNPQDERSAGERDPEQGDRQGEGTQKEGIQREGGFKEGEEPGRH